MSTDSTIEMANHSQSMKEELIEAFLTDVMGQLNGLDPNDDGDELLALIKETCMEPEDNKIAAQLFSFMLGMSLEEWLEDFQTE